MTAKIHLLNSFTLIVFGIWGYLVGGSFTALIPFSFGLILLFLYKGVKSEDKVIAHIAVMLTFIILIALIVQPLKVALSTGDSGRIFRSSVMVLTSALAMISFILSFMRARRSKRIDNWGIFMKKINIYIFSFLLLISSISFSDFNINFFSSYGFYNQDGLSPLLPNVGDGDLVQLVYAGENDQIDEITDYELSTGDDVVISSFEVINDGSEFSEYAFGTYGTVTSPYLGNGYVYGRVFSDLLPIVGTSYYVGSLFQAIDMDLDVVPPFVPESYNLGGDNGGIASSVLNFETNVVSTIYLTVTNSIGGLVNNEGTTVFYEPTTISVEATADLGYLFSSWNDEQGNSQSSENPYNFDLNKDQILIATFEPDLSDSDQDGLTLYDEVIVYGSDPNQSDTSGDGLLDGTLVLMGLEPTINFSNLVNTLP